MNSVTLHKSITDSYLNTNKFIYHTLGQFPVSIKFFFFSFDYKLYLYNLSEIFLYNCHQKLCDHLDFSMYTHLKKNNLLVLISLSSLNLLLFYFLQISFMNIKPVSYLLFNCNRIAKCNNNIFTQHIHACTCKTCYETTSVLTCVLCFSTIGWKNVLLGATGFL